MVAEWVFNHEGEPPINKRVIAYIMSLDLLSIGHFEHRERDGKLVFIADAGGAYLLSDISVWDKLPIIKDEHKTIYSD